MERKWSGLSPEEKSEERFKKWLSPDRVNFSDADAEKLYKERVSRFIAAIKLEEPDRVPVVFNPGHAPARYSGYTVRDVMYDPDKLVKAWEKYLNDFEFDALPSPGVVRCGGMLDILDAKMLMWAGHGLPDDLSAQYVEGEYLKADEWELMKQDPGDFHLRTYLPRIFGSAEPFRKLPPLQSIGGFGGGFSAFADPEVQAAFEAFRKAGEMEKEWRRRISEVDRRGRESGLPTFFVLTRGGAPLDSIAAALRGTRGTIHDMFRQPEKLIEYMEDAVPKQIQAAAAVADMTGVPVTMMPLHRGADGFMSEEQFHTFYWPYLRAVILGCVEEGVVPALFAEGGYNTRLEVLQDLPRGKVIWFFDQTDMARAKEILGNTCCIMGNVPTSLLITGTVDDVDSYCKNLIETAGKGGGYILSPGATADDSKVENLQAMFHAAQKYGVYKT
jgi:uroporphyrinogen-III decarboxylase